MGTYSYTSSNSYKLKTIKLNDQGQAHYLDAPVQDIVYNAFKKPVSVLNKNQGRVNFDYGVLQNRSHAYYGGQETDKTKHRYHMYNYSKMAQ